MSGPTPFRGRIARVPIPMRTLYRFEKPGGHWAEIRERKIAQFGGLEYIVFVDGSLLESEMFHGARLSSYPASLEARIKQFTDEGWRQLRVSNDPVV